MYYVTLFLNSEILYVTLCRRVLRSNGVSHHYHVQNDTTWQLMVLLTPTQYKVTSQEESLRTGASQVTGSVMNKLHILIVILVHMRESLVEIHNPQRCET